MLLRSITSLTSHGAFCVDRSDGDGSGRDSHGWDGGGRQDGDGDSHEKGMRIDVGKHLYPLGENSPNAQTPWVWDAIRPSGAQFVGEYSFFLFFLSPTLANFSLSHTHIHTHRRYTGS